MRIIEIEVTWHDITTGNRCSMHTCAVALAASRKLECPVVATCNDLEVGGQTFALLPIEARRFIRHFDDPRSLVAPMKFRVSFNALRFPRLVQFALPEEKI